MIRRAGARRHLRLFSRTRVFEGSSCLSRAVTSFRISFDAMSDCRDRRRTPLSGSCTRYPSDASMSHGGFPAGSPPTSLCVQCRAIMVKRIHSYEPRSGHGLPHDPIASILGPRPIGWISSRDTGGRLNLAPYSFFNVFNYDPPIVAFSSVGEKDSVRNVRDVGEFVCNLSTRVGRHEKLAPWRH